MKQPRTLRLLAVGAGISGLLLTSSFAQGVDDCAGAQAIAGTGDWNFLLFTATTDGLPSSVCSFFSQDQIENDVWFAWTATQTGMVDLDTCNTSTVDTKIAVYDGATCPTSDPIACNDDAGCGLQSETSWSATAGQVYLIRVGTYPGAAVGGGQIHVVEANGGGGGNGGADDCANAQMIAGTGTFGFDNSAATLDGSGDGVCEAFGQNQVDNDVWFQWTAPADDGFTLSTCGLTAVDTKVAVYDSLACPTGSPVACNDDTCALQSEVTFQAFAGNSYLIRLGTYPGAAGGTGEFEIEPSGSGGGGCANPAMGADVIIGELIGVENYGGLNGQSAFSIGTTSCNVGSAELLWISQTNEHPVISQNIYRLENGRFQQIGMGWLKHGFTALQGNVCCVCNPSGTGSRLGVGCSDPYSASLNGLQSGLGPRSEVNAFTGGFPYPYTIGFNQSGDTLYKRIQVLNSDIDPGQRPTAEYFGEGHYVTPDDAAAGNGENNASYRPMSVTGTTSGGFTMQMNGATTRTEPAIQAWKDTDPTVNLQDVLVPGEGLFKVGSNAYDNGNGTWRYEYAIHNLNSDYSGQKLTIPSGSNVSITGEGMSFPDYHSGDPYTNQGWASSVSGGNVEWATETFLQNANANALRWGTTYSFWFVANTPPTTRTGQMTLFKPGNPGVQMFDVVAPSDGSGGGPIVTNYCPANANSTGVSADVTAINIDLTARTMDLVASNLPMNSSGYFITSRDQAFLANPAGSQGNLCVNNPVGRFLAFVQNSGAGSTFSILVDLDMIPQPTSVVSVMSGESWNFQAWYRDSLAGVAVSNFTNGVEVQFP